ncbi:MAG: hypothetical protein KJO05_10125 [Bacteroidia bacterium]|nr:hypothetical protein [Bacteroidia bacterium]NNF29906.1 hypothetical protein [Flavobacteriaceae bacterium]MBT8276890.1 hypothetical protein [Bacteroidia bacterium]NNJ81620.1 hypothetical protein [Flavobacteriaceae bacterium]NNK55044.1 hypothetical protein [Flavobacteriaceae bacterium]
MKNKMSEIDDLIKQTLSEEEAEFYNQLDEQNPFEMIGGLFSGKNRWFMILLNIIMLASFIAFIYCVVQFLNTENTNELIQWGAAGMLTLLIMTVLKIFAWMQMDKNALLREIKRLEIQISSLASKQN